MTTTTPHDRRSHAADGWFKSSRSAPNGECVEIKFDHPADLVRIRDTKDRGEGPMISMTTAQWALLLAELAGTAPAGSNGAVTVHTTASECALLRSIGNGTTLTFTHAEWKAFLAGAELHEFDYPRNPIAVPHATAALTN